MFGMTKKQTRTFCWAFAVVLAAIDPVLGVSIGLFFAVMEFAGH
jgi:hypothetical protein